MAMSRLPVQPYAPLLPQNLLKLYKHTCGEESGWCETPGSQQKTVDVKCETVGCQQEADNDKRKTEDNWLEPIVDKGEAVVSKQKTSMDKCETVSIQQETDNSKCDTVDSFEKAAGVGDLNTEGFSKPFSADDENLKSRMCSSAKDACHEDKENVKGEERKEKIPSAQNSIAPVIENEPNRACAKDTGKQKQEDGCYHLPSHIINNIKDLLNDNVEGICVEKFCCSYMKKFGSCLISLDYGFGDIIDLLKALPDSVSMRYNESKDQVMLLPKTGEAGKTAIKSSLSQHLPDAIITTFQTILKEYHGGIMLDTLIPEYEMRTGKKLEISELGFSSIPDLLSHLPDDVFKVFQYDGQQLLCDPTFANLKLSQGFHSLKGSSSDCESRRTLNHEVVTRLKILVEEEFPGGLNINEVLGAYLGFFGASLEDLNPESYGFRTLEALLSAHPEVVNIQYQEGTVMVLANETVFPLISDETHLSWLLNVAEVGDSYKKLDVSTILPVDKMVDVVIGEVYTPHRFWIIHRGQYTFQSLNALMDCMLEFYSSPLGDRYLVPQERIAFGAPVVALYAEDRSYYRAIITSLEDIRTVKLFFVDYGTVCQCDASDLRLIHRRFFALPAQAMKASLCGVIPLGGKRWWSHATSQTFLQMIQNKGLVAHIVLSKETTHMNLWDTTGEDDVSIGNILIAKGLAIPSFSPPLDELEKQESSYDSVIVHKELSSSERKVIESISPEINNRSLALNMNNPHKMNAESLSLPLILDSVTQAVHPPRAVCQEVTEPHFEFSKPQNVTCPLKMADRDTNDQSSLSDSCNDHMIDKNNLNAPHEFIPVTSVSDLEAGKINKLVSQSLPVKLEALRQRLYEDYYLVNVVLNQMKSCVKQQSSYLHLTQPKDLDPLRRYGMINSDSQTISASLSSNLSATHQMTNPSQFVSSPMNHQVTNPPSGLDLYHQATTSSGFLTNMTPVLAPSDICTGLNDEFFYSDEEGEVTLQCCTSPKKRHCVIRSAILTDSNTLHIIVLNGMPFVLSAEISSLLWHADVLQSLLHQKGIEMAKVDIKKETDADVIIQLVESGVNAVYGDNGKILPSLTAYHLRTLPQILQIFACDNSVLLSAVKNLIHEYERGDSDEAHMKVDANEENSPTLKIHQDCKVENKPNPLMLDEAVFKNRSSEGEDLVKKHSLEMKTLELNDTCPQRIMSSGIVEPDTVPIVMNNEVCSTIKKETYEKHIIQKQELEQPTQLTRHPQSTPTVELKIDTSSKFLSTPPRERKIYTSTKSQSTPSQEHKIDTYSKPISTPPQEHKIDTSFKPLSTPCQEHKINASSKPLSVPPQEHKIDTSSKHLSTSRQERKIDTCYKPLSTPSQEHKIDTCSKLLSTPPQRHNNDVSSKSLSIPPLNKPKPLTKPFPGPSQYHRPLNKPHYDSQQLKEPQECDPSMKLFHDDIKPCDAKFLIIPPPAPEQLVKQTFDLKTKPYFESLMKNNDPEPLVKHSCDPKVPTKSLTSCESLTRSHCDISSMTKSSIAPEESLVKPSHDPKPLAKLPPDCKTTKKSLFPESLIKSSHDSNVLSRPCLKPKPLSKLHKSLAHISLEYKTLLNRYGFESVSNPPEHPEHLTKPTCTQPLTKHPCDPKPMSCHPRNSKLLTKPPCDKSLTDACDQKPQITPPLSPESVTKPPHDHKTITKHFQDLEQPVRLPHNPKLLTEQLQDPLSLTKQCDDPESKIMSFDFKLLNDLPPLEIIPLNESCDSFSLKEPFDNLNSLTKPLNEPDVITKTFDHETLTTCHHDSKLLNRVTHDLVQLNKFFHNFTPLNKDHNHQPVRKSLLDPLQLTRLSFDSNPLIDISHDSNLLNPLCRPSFDLMQLSNLPNPEQLTKLPCDPMQLTNQQHDPEPLTKIRSYLKPLNTFFHELFSNPLRDSESLANLYTSQPLTQPPYGIEVTKPDFHKSFIRHHQSEAMHTKLQDFNSFINSLADTHRNVSEILSEIELPVLEINVLKDIMAFKRKLVEFPKSKASDRNQLIDEINKLHGSIIEKDNKIGEYIRMFRN